MSGLPRNIGAQAKTPQITTIKQAEKIVGGLGKPSKMPGYSYGLPAQECKVGSLLAKQPNTVCSDCYALKGRYVFDNVQKAMYRRLATLYSPDWVDAMIYLMHNKTGGIRYFRWHDSGDLQSTTHLENIIEVAHACPETNFWLPTREAAIIKRTYASPPSNLVIRVSAPLIGSRPRSTYRHTSTVTTEPNDVTCPARLQGNQCGECRMCWDPAVKNVSYPKH